MSQEYFSHHYVSNSDLKKLRKLIDPKFEDPSDLVEIFVFGTLVHALILEPHNADLTHKDIVLAKRMRDTFFNDRLCRDFISLPDFEREKEFYNPPLEEEDERDGPYGIKQRIKADGWSTMMNTIMEFKGVSCESEKSFETAIDRFDWDQGLAFYLDTCGAQNALLVGVSKKSPKQIFKRFIDRNHVYYKRGRVKVLKHVQLLKEYVGDNAWEEQTV